VKVIVRDSAEQLGAESANSGARAIEAAIAARGNANIIVATGVSQFATLRALIGEPGIDWAKVTGFHLDEYIGVPISHPASFRAYLQQRLVDRVSFREFHYINGEGDPLAECGRINEIIRRHPIDVAFVGIGENSHLAFNDPPADFTTDEPYIVVDLDDACRRQQFGEGWFPTFEDVPKRAISMSVRQILKSKTIICSALDDRKSAAVAASLEGPVTPDIPASILQQHPDTLMYLDQAAAVKLRQPT
jgi:glucosamine-6-phosphate deaminase